MAGIIFTLLILAATPELNAQAELPEPPTPVAAAEVTLIEFDVNNELMFCPNPDGVIFAQPFFHESPTPSLESALRNLIRDVKEFFRL